MPSTPDPTCWTMVRAAASGDAAARSRFTHVYEDVVRGFFEGRWRHGPLATEVPDAVQEVFVECLEEGGALERAESDRGQFRGFLYGVARNVARRVESARMNGNALRAEESVWIREAADDEPGQSALFDRSWARALVSEAGARHRKLAAADGEAGRRRLELLQRRFSDDEPIRQIAKRWGMPVQEVHNAYKKARMEFYRCLREVVAFHQPNSSDLEAECRSLLGLLG